MKGACEEHTRGLLEDERKRLEAKKAYELIPSGVQV